MDEVCVVRISTVEYERLLNHEMAFNLLIDAIFEGSRLSYNEEYLTFDDEYLKGLIKLLAKRRYDATLKMLQNDSALKKLQDESSDE